MTINWGALGVVAVVSLVIGVLLVVLVSLALVGLSAREPGPAGEEVAIDGNRGGVSRTAGTVIAVICLLATSAIVVYGLYIIAF
jgi:hypothetical protein